MPVNNTLSGRPPSSPRGAQPIDGKACEFIVFIDTTTIGHAFFKLIDAHGNKVVLGFYPFNLLIDDSNHVFSHSARYFIDTMQHEAMLHRAREWPATGLLGISEYPGQTIEQQMEGRYGLTGNCVTYVLEVAKAGGIRLPVNNFLPGDIPHEIAEGMKKTPKMVCKISDKNKETIYSCVEK